MTNPSKVKGDRAERDVTQWLTEHRGLRAERIRAGRSTDAGDITWPGSDWVCDVKNQRRWTVQTWFADLEHETAVESSPERRLKPLLILRRPGLTNAGTWLAITTLQEFEL